MDIFESLENLNISEECFDEIMGIVEEIFERWAETHNQQDLNNKVENSKELRKKKYKEAVDSNASPEVIERAKKRLHRVNVLSHTSTLGNKKEKRSSELANTYGKNPSIKSLQDVKKGEEPKLTDTYFREIRNLGKPESQKENPNMANIHIPTDSGKKHKSPDKGTPSGYLGSHRHLMDIMNKQNRLMQR